MPLSNEDQKYYENMQENIAATACFLQNFQTIRASQPTLSTVDAYDSCVSGAAADQKTEYAIPQILVDIFDSVGDSGKPFILGALETGINGYKAAHGGEMPRADIVTSALAAGLSTLNEYDSANGTQLNSAGMESNSVVPAQAIVTIATRIANALPLVAYLPNSSGSNEVPIIYGRNIAKNTIGAVAANDFLDGPSSCLQYFDPQFEFLAVKDATDPKKYTLSPTVAYDPAKDRAPLAGAAALAFMGGRVRIYVNGVEVANDATIEHAKFDGISTIVPVLKHKLVLKDSGGLDVEVKLNSGEANLTTNSIEIVFTNELPDDAEVTFNLIADYERKKDGQPVLVVPSVDIDLIARRVYSYPMRAIYRASRDSVNQMQRELGVDAFGAITAVVAGKYMLEQNIRLLSQLKRRAKGFNRVLSADLSRGATDTAVFNNTSEQARELLVTVSSGKVLINSLLDVVPSGHDIYVSDKMAVVFDNLADDTHYTKISSAIGAPNQITRIGTLPGGTNVYHIPKSSKLLNEQANAAEIMLVGRSGEAVRNPFVGFVCMPMTVRESQTVDFEQGVAIQANQAAELNPLERFADQCVVIEVTNLPVSVVGA